MSKNRYIKSIINSVSITVLHSIITNYPRGYSESKTFKEYVEYRGQLSKKLIKVTLNDIDKKRIREKSIINVKNDLIRKYPHIEISKEKISKEVDEELKSIFD